MKLAKLIEAENRMVVARGCEEAEMGSYKPAGVKFQLNKMKTQRTRDVPYNLVSILTSKTSFTLRYVNWRGTQLARWVGHGTLDLEVANLSPRLGLEIIF